MDASAKTTAFRHTHLDEKAIPFIGGTTMMVVELVLAQQAYRWSAEELHFQHPDLTMSQIHSALAYCWEYKTEIDADIEQRSHGAERLRQEFRPSPLAQRLREQGSIE
jgi:uncharacterized protein (DUF433 family)